MGLSDLKSRVLDALSVIEIFPYHCETCRSTEQRPKSQSGDKISEGKICRPDFFGKLPELK